MKTYISKDRRINTYEPGKIYTLHGDDLLDGFCFCKDIELLMEAFNREKEFNIKEIEVLGSVRHDSAIYSFTNKFKLIGNADIKNWAKYDKNGNVICSNKGSWIRKFDEKGRIISLEDRFGETLYHYDEMGNCIKSECYDGEYHTENIVTFDKKGNCISCMRTKYGLEDVFEYNDDNKLIYYKSPVGAEWRYKYDESGNCIYSHYKNKNDCEKWFEYKYDDNGNVIYRKDNNGKSYSITIE